MSCAFLFSSILPPLLLNGVVSMAGMIVWYGRLFGARTLGWSLGETRNAEPRFCKVNPQPLGIIPEPKSAETEL